MPFNRLQKKQPTTIEIDDYLKLFENIKNILLKNNHQGQARAMLNLIELLQRNQIDLFIKNLNSVDIWGGSGAVWEVYIEDKPDYILFQTEIIKLINLMEKDNILGRGIKPIKRVFVNEIRKNQNSSLKN